MKPIYLIALLALGSVSCVDDYPKLQILQSTPPDSSCTIPDNRQLLNGSLNLALAGNYQMGLIVTSNVLETPIVVGAPLTDPDGNAIYVTELDLSYRTEPELNIPSATVPIHGTFRAAGNGAMLLNIFTLDALQALRSATGGANFVETLVTLKVRGKMLDGSKVETNTITYSVQVGNIPFSCPPGKAVEPPTEACDQRGQNGVLPACN
ncbi:putative lipoprotein [Myxococcus stipitatus DSM 14675]|uniref:Putative lipoprotein n=1 Tax=Myxococcus stipitatus (strain DSM 14675 / JCM 12634 / Mx s8) TaxID=1278073 RepID=L7UIC3_MYXSD|nr:hypothetical protein [Myxococcus stipitatus]AGC47630.1 putative lipoprotein [Myxococcus stipitatus DSM 14675]